MSFLKQEPGECPNINIKQEGQLGNIKSEIKQEKNASQDKAQTTPGTYLCTCNQTAHIAEEKPKPKFNAKKFHRIYVEWNPNDENVPVDKRGIVAYFSQWGAVQNSWIRADQGLACVEYRGSQSVSNVQMARPHGQTRTRRCHPIYHPAVRNILLIAQDNPGKNTPALLQHLSRFGEVINFSSNFMRERNWHLIFVTFQDYDSVDWLILKLYLRMGSWKFYVIPVKGLVTLGSDGFPVSYQDPVSGAWHDFAKNIPENLPPGVAAAAQNNAASSTNSCPALTCINRNANAHESPICRASTSSAAITTSQDGSIPIASTSRDDSIPTASTSRDDSIPTATTSRDDSIPTASTSRDDSIPTASTPRDDSIPTASTPRDDSIPTASTSRDDSISTASTSQNGSIPLAAPGKSTDTAIDLDDEIEVLEVPKIPPEMVDLTLEDSHSSEDDEIEVEYEDLTPRNNEVTVVEVVPAQNGSGAEEDDIVFIGEVVHQCNKCGGKIIVVTLD